MTLAFYRQGKNSEIYASWDIQVAEDVKRGKESSKRTVMPDIFLKAQEPSLQVSNGSPQHPFGKQDRGRDRNTADSMMKLKKGLQTNQGDAGRET